MKQIDNNIFYVGLFLIFLAFFSCKKAEKNILSKEKTSRINLRKDSLWFDSVERTTSNDSLNIKIGYSLTSDTINLDSEDKRFTIFYFTDEKKISDKEMKKIIENDDKKKMKKFDFKAFMLTKENKFKFTFEYKGAERIYLRGFIDDIVFMKNYTKKDSTKIIHRQIFAGKTLNIVGSDNY